MLSVAIYIASLSFTITNADRPVNWFEIKCPTSSGAQSCTYNNQYDVDIAISLFFQTEDNSGSSFSCVSSSKTPSKPFTCPSPMVYSYNNYWSYCLLENLAMPSDLSKVEAYCEYLAQGYEGFTFATSDFPNYKCPSSMSQGHNNQGTTFCTITLPKDTVDNLPNDTQSFCTEQAFQANELGFRYNNNGSTPTPTIEDDALVYCSRAWNMEQEGSAGDCYFILPKGESFSCHGKGTTSIIGAHAVQLGGTYFASGSKKLTNISSYTNTNTNKDEWIYLEMESTGKNTNGLQCNYRTTKGAEINLCNFTASNAASSVYSCNFALPAGKQMQCATSGNILVTTAVSKTMTVSMLGDAEPLISTKLCPNVTYPDSTMCDCYFENPSQTDDILIIVESNNMNSQFDSYHCYVWGVNVCAWGANNDNKLDAGGCYFILPAGAMYNCSMQWGATSFLSSTAMKLDGTIYVKNQPDIPSVDWYHIPGTKLPQSRSTADMKILWNKWKLRHNKQYGSADEEWQRFTNFRQFVSLADNTNHGIKVDEIKNDMADLSMQEFNDLYRGCALPSQFYDKDKNMWKLPKSINLTAIPTSVDWRTKGAITPIKDQGQCGSCWSFSTTGVLESHWEILSGRLQSLSEQELVSCEKDCYGCDGGWPYKAIEWVSKNGIETEASYNYTSGGGNTGTCNSQNGKAAGISGHVTGYQFVESDETAMAAYVANYGPISISLDAMTQIWWPYSDTSGIMQGCCNKDPDHAVLIIGYGVDSNSSLPYWIIKNSWGTSWGYDGYLYLERGSNQCGITYQPVVPTLKN